MERIDEVTLKEILSPYCPDCGDMDSVLLLEDPFRSSYNTIIIPLYCRKCTNNFYIELVLRVGE